MQQVCSIVNMWISSSEASYLSLNEVQSKLSVDLTHGLSSLEVSRRRDIHGFNEVNVGKPDPLWKKYVDQFNNPFILLLLLSAFISVCMKQYDDAVCVTVAIIIVVTVGFIQEYRSEKTLEKMGSLLPPICSVLRDGVQQQLLARQLVPGDVVFLNVGDKVPADLRMFEVNELSIDESSFTGEPVAKRKQIGEINNSNSENYKSMDISDMKNIGFQGTLVTDGKGTGVVISTGENSQFGEIFKAMKAEEPPRSPLQKSMDMLGKQLTAISLGVIGLIMLFGCLLGQPIFSMFNVGVSLAVAAIPEGLPIVVTVTLAFGVMRMANRNSIIKRLPTCEALGCVDVICSDKTGTLTANDMVVKCDMTAGQILGDLQSDNENTKSNDTNDTDTDALLEISVLCNNAQVNSRKHSVAGREITDSRGFVYSGTATEKALLKFCVQRGMEKRRFEYHRVSEIPFSSDRKFMAVQCQSIKNPEAEKLYFVKGAIEEILAQCTSVLLCGKTMKLSQSQSNLILSTAQAFASKGLRVLGMARGFSPNSLEFVGLLGLHDPPREGVKESIALLKNSKVKVCMITGDAKETAAAIAESLGICDTKHLNEENLATFDSATNYSESTELLLSGSQIDQMSDANLAQIADRVVAYYRTTPLHKLRIVKALQSNGHIVAMTGDGVNDGVAIKKADVGISMGIAGTDVCKEAADMILLDDNFSTILSAIEEGKCIFNNIRNFVRFQLSTSIAALMLISICTLLKMPNPLNPMQILWINVIMDGPPAQSLGLEPADPGVLKKPPRSTKEQILTRSLLINIVLSAVVIIIGTMWVHKSLAEDGKTSARDVTMTFTCFVFFDMWNALSSRSQERLVVEIGILKNHVFCVAVALSVIGQLAVIYLPPLQYIFQTEALTLGDLIGLLLITSSVFFVIEGKKYIDRHSYSAIIQKCKGILDTRKMSHFNKNNYRNPGNIKKQFDHMV